MTITQSRPTRQALVRARDEAPMATEADQPRSNSTTTPTHRTTLQITHRPNVGTYQQLVMYSALFRALQQQVMQNYQAHLLVTATNLHKIIVPSHAPLQRRETVIDTHSTADSCNRVKYKLLKAIEHYNSHLADYSISQLKALADTLVIIELRHTTRHSDHMQLGEQGFSIKDIKVTLDTTPHRPRREAGASARLSEALQALRDVTQQLLTMNQGHEHQRRHFITNHQPIYLNPG